MYVYIILFSWLPYHREFQKSTKRNTISLYRKILSVIIKEQTKYIWNKTYCEAVMSKNTIIRGTLILTITGLCTKLLGFYYRIFLTKLIGVQQLGIYQLVFPLYILMFSFCGQGFCQALTKHVSAYLGRQKYNCMNRTLSYALIISVSLSIVTSSLVYANANTISLAVLKNTECTPLLQLLCFAIPFVVFKAIINS